MTGYTMPPANATDPATPLPERLAALAAWWRAESDRLAERRPHDSAEVRAMREQRSAQYRLCAEDLAAVLAVPAPAAAGHHGTIPAACNGCQWTYHRDGAHLRLAHIDPACPVHGPAAPSAPRPVAASLVMAVDRPSGIPRACEGCAWTYWGDGGRWRLTRIDPACPEHGAAGPSPASDSPEVTR